MSVWLHLCLCIPQYWFPACKLWGPGHFMLGSLSLVSTKQWALGEISHGYRAPNRWDNNGKVPALAFLKLFYAGSHWLHPVTPWGTALPVASYRSLICAMPLFFAYAWIHWCWLCLCPPGDSLAFSFLKIWLQLAVVLPLSFRKVDLLPRCHVCWTWGVRGTVDQSFCLFPF